MTPAQSAKHAACGNKDAKQQIQEPCVTGHMVKDSGRAQPVEMLHHLLCCPITEVSN